MTSQRNVTDTLYVFLFYLQIKAQLCFETLYVSSDDLPQISLVLVIKSLVEIQKYFFL